MTGKRGFTLIEVVVVMVIIAISLGLAGPRIGAGLGRLELNQAEQTVRSIFRTARLHAQRSDRPQYIVLNRESRSISIIGPEMAVLREEILPSSVEIVLGDDNSTKALTMTPSGMLRGDPIRLRSRFGESQVSPR